jgi:DNA-binding transcriptional LysR family regulator
VRGFGPIATRLVAGNVHDAVVDLVEGHSDLLLCYHHPHHPVELDSDRYPMLELGAEALKVMALEGHGVAWLPDSAVVRELRDRQLALAVRPSAAAAWRGEMAIRLYRDAGHTRPVVMALWSYLANREAPGLHADR